MALYADGQRQQTALTTTVTGSIEDVAKSSGRTLAEAFISAEVMALVDVSGSMAEQDSRGRRSRYDVACEELARLQAANPGRVAIIAFSGQPRYCPGGVPAYDGGGTDLAGALRFAGNVLPASMRVVVISDGMPDDPQAALRAAAALACDVDTVYVGPERDNGGRQFLAELARRKRGQHVTASRAIDLAAQVQQLLLGTGSGTGTTTRGGA